MTPTAEMQGYMAQALLAEDCPMAARLVGDFGSLFPGIAMPINPRPDDELIPGRDDLEELNQ